MQINLETKKKKSMGYEINFVNDRSRTFNYLIFLQFCLITVKKI
jgi:hypothetical protein